MSAYDITGFQNFCVLRIAPVRTAYRLKIHEYYIPKGVTLKYYLIGHNDHRYVMFHRLTHIIRKLNLVCVARALTSLRQHDACWNLPYRYSDWLNWGTTVVFKRLNQLLPVLKKNQTVKQSTC